MRLAEYDRHATDERPDELLPFLQAPGLQQTRKVAEGSEAIAKYGVGVSRLTVGAISSSPGCAYTVVFNGDACLANLCARNKSLDAL